MKKVILIMVSVVNLFGWEINTHRAIDRQAAKYSSNFQYFVKHSGVKNNNYRYENFEGYGHNMTYINYVLNGEKNGISADKWHQAFNTSTVRAQDLIEAGAILEDSIYEKAPLSFMGRFNNHFYDPQNGGHALTFGYGLRVNALKWGTRGAYDALGSRENRYSYNKALNYFEKAFSSSSLFSASDRFNRSPPLKKT